MYFFGDGDDEAEVGLDQLALGLVGIHVSLDHLALGALELDDQNAGLGLDLFKIGLTIFLLAAILLFEPLAAARFVLLFERTILTLRGCAWCRRSC